MGRWHSNSAAIYRKDLTQANRAAYFMAESLNTLAAEPADPRARYTLRET